MMPTATRPTATSIVRRLRAASDPSAVDGQRRFGIRGANALGIRVPVLRAMAKEIGRDHGLAERLWRTGIHDARLLATMVGDPAQVTPGQMDRWAAGFDSWDVVDQACGNLFDRTPYAADKALEWAERHEEYVKRAAFSLMAEMAVHDKAAPDVTFEPFLDAIERHAWDDRNFVRKAVNWALREIGKRNRSLHARATATAERIRRQRTRSARWIAADALRELKRDAVRARLR
jgi:3-methyladenine DNA glycosylase AlkD